MKFGFLFSDIDLANYTGQPLVAMQLVQSALENGHEAVIVSNANSTNNLDLDLTNIDSFIMKGTGSLTTYVTNFLKILMFLKKHKVDCLFVHGALFAVAVRPLALILRLPMIVSTCEVVDMHSKFLQKAIANCFAAAKAILVTAKVIQDQLVTRGVARAKIHIFRLGVRPNFFLCANGCSSTSHVDMLFWGDSKIDRSFDTFVRLAEELPHLQFRALLRWKDNDCQNELLRFGKLPNTEVLVYPYQQPLTAYIQASNIAILPFRFMGVRPPISLLEAMAMSKCVVTTSMAGNEEVVQNNESGFILDFDSNWTVAVDFLRNLALNHNLQTVIGSNARKCIKKMDCDSSADINYFWSKEVPTLFIKNGSHAQKYWA